MVVPSNVWDQSLMECSSGGFCAVLMGRRFEVAQEHFVFRVRFCNELEDEVSAHSEALETCVEVDVS